MAPVPAALPDHNWLPALAPLRDATIDDHVYALATEDMLEVPVAPGLRA